MQKNWHFLTDIEGVYKDPEDKATLISELTVSDAAKELIAGRIHRRRYASKVEQLY